MKLTTIEVERTSHGPNYRASGGDVSGLRRSIERVGLLQPILVVEAAEGGGWEVVAGNRRLAAVRELGLAEIPAVVMESDAERLTTQLAENTAREDPHPLDEALAFARLVDAGVDVGDLAAAVGRSESYVRRRVKLTGLADRARAALREGSITLGAAEQIARLDRVEDQEEALQLVSGRAAGGAETWRLIEARFVRRLGSAPFELRQTYAELEPCTVCPKRTSVQADLFGAIEGDDRCLDGRCFGQKSEIHWAQAQTAAAKRGREVLSEAEAAKVFLGWTDAPSPKSGYVLGSDPHWADPDKRTWAELVGDESKAILARTPRGRIVELYRREEAEEAAAGHEEVPVEAPSERRAVAAEARSAARSASKEAEALRRRIVAGSAQNGLELAAWSFLLRDALDRFRGTGAAAKRAASYRDGVDEDGAPLSLFRIQAALLDLALTPLVKASGAAGKVAPVLVELGELYGAEVPDGEG